MHYIYLISLLAVSFTVHAQPGTPDITFGNGGRVNIDLGFDIQSPWDLKVLPDGKMLVGGIQYNGNSDGIAFLTRLTAEGEIDSTFGVSGLAPVFTQPGFDVRAAEIRLLSDGKFIVMFNAYSQSLQYKTAMRKYSPAGSLDNTFGTNGQTISPPGMKFSGADLDIAPDGNIIIGGINYTNTQGANFSLLSYNPNGTPSTNFGNNGRVEFHLGSYNDDLNNIAIQADGKIVGAGSTVGDFVQLILLRLNTDGTPDTTFATDGFFSDTYNNVAGSPRDLHLLPDGDILLAGYSTAFPDQGTDYALYKFKNNGIRDSTFGINGLKSYDFGEFYDYISASLLQPDGKLIISGGNSIETFVMARMDTQGEPDPNFGGNGKITSNSFEVYKDLEYCQSIRHYPGNKLVAITTYGDYLTTGIQRWAVIRLNNDDATITGSPLAAVQPKKIFPNPTNSGKFTLELTLDVPSELTVSLFDAAGKKLQTMLRATRSAGDWQETLHIADHLPKGVYFLKVQTGNGTEVLPVVKN